MRLIKRVLIWIGLIIVIDAAIGRGLQITAEHYFFTATAEANSAPPLTMLEIVYREGDGAEFVFHCATTHDDISIDKLFTENEADFEQLKAAYCAATVLIPAV